MDLHAIRQEYSQRELSATQCADNPIIQFEQWLHDAMNAQVAEPTAMNIATVDANGRPSARIVLLKEVNEQGFVFFTNYAGRKGQALAHQPFAALTFFGRNWNDKSALKAKSACYPKPNRTLILPVAPTPAALARGQANKVK